MILQDKPPSIESLISQRQDSEISNKSGGGGIKNNSYINFKEKELKASASDQTT